MPKDGKIKLEFNKRNTSISIDNDLRLRLRAVAGYEHGGVSRVAEDCIRAYLPVFELMHKERVKSQTKNHRLGVGTSESSTGDGVFDANIFVQPEVLGRAMVFAIRSF
jgi:hypothetical protein